MLDEAVAAFHGDPTLSSAVAHLFADNRESPAGDPWGPQIVESGAVMFAAVLCHRAVLALTTTHFKKETKP